MAETQATLIIRFASALARGVGLLTTRAFNMHQRRRMQAVIAMLAITTLIAAACGGDPKAPDDSASSPARQVDTPDVVAEQPDPDATEPAVDKPPTATDEGASEPAQPSADLDPVEPVESPPVVEAGDDPVRTEPLPYDNDLAIEVLRTLAVEIGPRVQGTSGEAAAADFLAESFTSFGYRVERQPFQVPSFGVESLEVRVNGTLIPASAFRFSAGGSVSGPLVPVPGFGAPADFASVDVTDGIALVERGELFFVDKVANAAAAGATAIIIYNNETGPIDGILSGGSEIPAIEVSRAAGISILADAVAGTVDVSIVLAGGFSLTDSQNVIASSGNGQCSIYVGGHYDSVPEVTGANDNASGTALVVELARAFAGSPGVDAVCFVGFGGEEGVAFSPGIAGSAALVADLVDKGVVGDVAAMMNLDVAAAGNVLVLIGTPSLVALATAIAAEADVFARPGSLPPGSGSDHVNFSNAGIPVIFPTVTGAAIHVPADNFDAIDPVLFNGIGQVAHGVLRCLIARAGESVAAPAGCPLSAG